MLQKDFMPFSAVPPIWTVRPLSLFPVMASESLVCTELFLHPGGGGQRAASCPCCLPPQLAYPFGLFWVTWMWLSPLVLLDLSLQHQGTVLSTSPKKEVPLRTSWRVLVPPEFRHRETLI